MAKKVSLVTSCYNGESYLGRYLECILSQDYPNIELIFVNDGSTDATESIFLSYQQKLEEKGISCKYIMQKNLGPAGAINTGIKYISGEYLAWPDSDDILLNNFISSRVNALEKHPQAGIVVCPIECVDESDINIIRRKENVFRGWSSSEERNIYMDILRLQNILVFPGSFMLRTSFFKETNPRQDFPHPREIGQNFQMLLPISYKYKACYTNVVSFRYVIRANSHSHAKKTKEQSIAKHQIGKKLLQDLTSIIPFESEAGKQETLRIIEWRYLRWLMEIGMEYDDFELYKHAFRQAKKMGETDWHTELEYIRFKFPLINHIVKPISKIKRIVIGK